MTDVVVKNEPLEVAFITFHSVLAVLLVGIAYLVTGVRIIKERYDKTKYRDLLMVFIGADIALWAFIIYAIILAAF